MSRKHFLDSLVPALDLPDNVFLTLRRHTFYQISEQDRAVEVHVFFRSLGWTYTDEGWKNGPLLCFLRRRSRKSNVHFHIYLNYHTIFDVNIENYFQCVWVFENVRDIFPCYQTITVDTQIDQLDRAYYAEEFDAFMHSLNWKKTSLVKWCLNEFMVNFSRSRLADILEFYCGDDLYFTERCFTREHFDVMKQRLTKITNNNCGKHPIL